MHQITLSIEYFSKYGLILVKYKKNTVESSRIYLNHATFRDKISIKFKKILKREERKIQSEKTGKKNNRERKNKIFCTVFKIIFKFLICNVFRILKIVLKNKKNDRNSS